MKINHVHAVYFSPTGNAKKVVTFGEIMLRLATPGYLRFSQCNELSATFGGGEANVAVSLANYGMNAEFVTRLPENDIAEACIKDLHKNGVKTSHIVRGGDRLGIYFLETGAVSRMACCSDLLCLCI